MTVKGPRGTLVRAFKHIKCEMKMLETGKMRLDFWWLTKKVRAPPPAAARCRASIYPHHIPRQFPSLFHSLLRPIRPTAPFLVTATRMVLSGGTWMVHHRPRLCGCGRTPDTIVTHV